MTTAKKGVLIIEKGDIAKHLRRWGKKIFWRRHRRAEQRLVQRQTGNQN